MKKKKLSLLHIFLIFFIIEFLFSFRMGYTLHVGVNPQTGSFSVWNQKEEIKLQEKIDEEFQTDGYIAKTNKPPEEFTYGSKTIYNVCKIFAPKTPISCFKTFRTILVIDLFWILVALMVRKVLQGKPTKTQLFFEMIYGFIDNLVVETMGTAKRKYVPYVLSIFLFVLSCNWIGLLPIPGLIEPTRNLNVTLGLGAMAVLFAHAMGLRKHGLKDYIKEYTEPMFFLAPLHLVGELAKIVSISFRLFGNIFGESIIVMVVSSLTYYVIMPVGLNMFFTLFSGTIQAFVFTTLSMTYLSIQISD